jgi:hypothetical protein
VRVHLGLQTLVVVVLAVAWSKASSEPLARAHEPWLNLGIGAVLVSGAVNGVFLMAARRAVADRRAELYRTACLTVPPPTRLGPMVGPQRSPEFAAGPAMTRYHHPTCALAAGKTVRLVPRCEHEAAGRRPCGICRP